MNNLELFKRNALSASATIIVYTQKYLIDGKVDLQGVADTALLKAHEGFNAGHMDPCNITVSPGITSIYKSVRVYAESNPLNLEPLDNEDDRQAWKLIVASIMIRIADEINGGLDFMIFYSDGTSCTASDYSRFMELSK